MWVVYDWLYGVVGMFEKEEEALKEYEKYKADNQAHFSREFEGEEELFVAKISKRLYAYDTGKEIIDDDGNITSGTYREWKEDAY